MKHDRPPLPPPECEGYYFKDNSQLFIALDFTVDWPDSWPELQAKLEDMEDLWPAAKSVELIVGHHVSPGDQDAAARAVEALLGRRIPVALKDARCMLS